MAVLGALVVGANVALRDQNINRVVLTGIVLVNLVLVLFGVGVLAGTGVDFENTEIGAVIIFVTAGIASLLLITDVREALASVFPKRSDANSKTNTEQNAIATGELFPYYAMLSNGETIHFGMPRFGMLQQQPTANTQSSSVATASQNKSGNELLGFDPHNTVHALALILLVWILGLQMGLFILGGGLSGYAEDIALNEFTLLANFIPLLGLSLLGVGLFTRRSWSEVLHRLGLTPPSWEEIGMGVVAAIGLFMLQLMLALAWMAVVGMETFEEQTEASGALAESVTTIWLALGIATTAAIGEEIAFRGALQPIIGLWWTAGIFTVLHMQYTLTPAAGIIFIVAVAFGYMRRHYSLYTAIIAHFLYNFVQLAINVAA